MADVTMTVRVIASYAQTAILGQDEQGRTLVRCPSAGCGDTAYIAEDGRVVCPTSDALSKLLASAYDKFLAAMKESRHDGDHR